MVNSKNAFWQALIFTIIIFILGLIFGFFLENFRTNGVQNNLMSSEINLLDEQLKEKASGVFPVSCEEEKKGLFDFADRIYGEALKLEQYSSSSTFSDESLTILHRRYDILRSMLWIESINLKERCPGHHDVVYIYEYNTEDVNKQSEQTSISRVLRDIKEKHPKDILLIPIAGNLNLTSVDLVMKSYNITKLPSVIVDEKKVITGLISENDLNNMVFG